MVFQPLPGQWAWEEIEFRLIPDFKENRDASGRHDGASGGKTADVPRI